MKKLPESSATGGSTSVHTEIKRTDGHARIAWANTTENGPSYQVAPVTVGTLPHLAGHTTARDTRQHAADLRLGGPRRRTPETGEKSSGLPSHMNRSRRRNREPGSGPRVSSSPKPSRGDSTSRSRSRHSTSRSRSRSVWSVDSNQSGWDEGILGGLAVVIGKLGLAQNVDLAHRPVSSHKTSRKSVDIDPVSVCARKIYAQAKGILEGERYWRSRDEGRGILGMVPLWIREPLGAPRHLYAVNCGNKKLAALIYALAELTPVRKQGAKVVDLTLMVSDMDDAHLAALADTLRIAQKSSIQVKIVVPAVHQKAFAAYIGRFGVAWDGVTISLVANGDSIELGSGGRSVVGIHRHHASFTIPFKGIQVVSCRRLPLAGLTIEDPSFDEFDPIEGKQILDILTFSKLLEGELCSMINAAIVDGSLERQLRWSPTLFINQPELVEHEDSADSSSARPVSRVRRQYLMAASMKRVFDSLSGGKAATRWKPIFESEEHSVSPGPSRGENHSRGRSVSSSRTQKHQKSTVLRRLTSRPPDGQRQVIGFQYTHKGHTVDIRPKIIFV